MKHFTSLPGHLAGFHRSGPAILHGVHCNQFDLIAMYTAAAQEDKTKDASIESISY